MTDEIPAEVYEAAAVAVHDHECADGSMCTATPTSMTRYAGLAKVAVDAVYPLAYAAGRRSIYDGWAANLAEDGPDETEEIRARVRREARALVEQEIRDEIAAGRAPREGICGEELPRLMPGTPAGVCELTYGHASPWHETPNADGSPCRWRDKPTVADTLTQEAK